MARSQMRNHDIASHVVRLTDVVTFIRDIDTHLAPHVAHVHTFASEVSAECAAFDANRDIDSKAHAQNAVLFAIISPQCKFAKNVSATARLMARLYDVENEADIVAVMTDDGRDNFMVAKPAARRIMRSLDYIRALTGEDMTLAAMKQARKDGVVVGLGDKTMRMALALYDASLEVYTLDVHMLRGIQHSCGGTVAAQMTINTTAYDALEAAMVDWHARHFSNLPTFVSQWALWNEWGFGRHQSHLGIFGLDDGA